MPDAGNSQPLNIDSVYSSVRSHTYTGSYGDYKDLNHKSAMALEAGTISLGFSIDRLAGNYALISKDQEGTTAGDFTVWIKDGQIVMSIETDQGAESITVPDVILSSHTTYQFAFSFGEAGLNIWLNGVLVASEPGITQGLEANKNDLVIGGTHAWNKDEDDAHSLLLGHVSDVQMYDQQLGGNNMITLANAIEPGLGGDARFDANMANLVPLFEQLDVASDTLLDLLADFGVNQDGTMSRDLNMIIKGQAGTTVTGTAEDDGINAGRGNDMVKGLNGNDVLQGGYGNDRLWGGLGDDILDGGHGEDRLWGGAGNDLLISQADAREPEIFYQPGRDETDAVNELTDGQVYPNQPIPGDDVLTGGSGADIFYFQTLINAKERIITKHTRDDGTINWAGVAGENQYLHDHWVDYLGHDVITDYSRGEGDRIVLEGHTTQISSIRYGDADGDGVIDHSIISLYSDQGNGGGAHDDDRLGTVTVYGDLITLADIEHTAAPTYGIINSIDNLKEALAPTDISADTGTIKPPLSRPTAEDLGLAKGTGDPVLATVGSTEFSSDDRIALVFDHSKQVDLTKGTIAFSFSPTSLDGYQALFSKDASGYGEGGHMTAYVHPLGHLVVRIQDGEQSHYLEVKHAISAGGSYDFALSFGPQGAELFLNGARVAYDKDIKVNWGVNKEALIVGAAGWNNEPGEVNKINSHFDGTISNFMVFDTQLDSKDIFGSDTRDDYTYLNGSASGYSFSWNSQGVLEISKGQQNIILDEDVEFIQFRDFTVRTDDFLFGGRGGNRIDGLDGSDIIIGRLGDDDLNGHDNNDLLIGGLGADNLQGGDGNDKLLGGGQDDRLYGGNGFDVLKGGNGNDVLYGGAGGDKFYGGLGDDYISGNEWNDKGKAKNDKAFFDGNLDDFTFETHTYYNSTRGENVIELIVTDSADGGSDGNYEGRDKLIDIDQLVFADQTVSFTDLL
ncbi:MAG: hypothetical protein L3J36_05165 [Rhodobacteraceae bacterium]|nr:hypothetical protein [Paracoccaceae bacterium]